MSVTASSRPPCATTPAWIAWRACTRATSKPRSSARAYPAGGFGLVVIDVSFISLTQAPPAVSRLAAEGAGLIALVKPQFEVGRAGLDHRGLVRDAALYDGVPRARVGDTLEGLRPGSCARLDAESSPITGGIGDDEFLLLHAQRPTGEACSRTCS
jgi:23S rRNA (cytidine1920-2'-O)/16S rRNA (cytidine1409-2'-O)-methyltransferase